MHEAIDTSYAHIVHLSQRDIINLIIVRCDSYKNGTLDVVKAIQSFWKGS